MKWMHAGLLGGMALLLAGCAVGPNYHRPRLDLVDAYAAQSTRTLTQNPEVEWWKTFNDEKMNGLIDQAVLANRDLRAAAARVREARALRAEASADFYPQIGGLAGVTRTKSSANAVVTHSVTPPSSGSSGSGGSGGSGSSSSSPNTAASAPLGTTTNLYQLGFDASWELDLFGRIRREVEAAQADLDAAQDAERGTLISLMGEVALNYIELRGFQRELDITNNNIAAQIQTLKITQIRYKAGLTSELDVANARAQLATTRSGVPGLETQIRSAAHQLGVLTGNTPEALLDDLLTSAPLPQAPVQVPVGLPSELLRRRPDVRQSERALAGTTARVGEAIADMFPRVTLNGTAGLTSAHSGNLFDKASHTWSFGPLATIPIFEGGRLLAGTQAARAREEEALMAYEQTALNALEDAENALTAYQHEWDRREQLAEAVSANQRAFDLSNALYTRGLTDFLNVLEAQGNLFQSQNQLANSDITLSTDVVAVYKALGGGWENTLPAAEGEKGERIAEAAAPEAGNALAKSDDAPKSMGTESMIPAGAMHRH